MLTDYSFTKKLTRKGTRNLKSTLHGLMEPYVAMSNRIADLQDVATELGISAA